MVPSTPDTRNARCCRFISQATAFGRVPFGTSTHSVTSSAVWLHRQLKAPPSSARVTSTSACCLPLDRAYRSRLRDTCSCCRRASCAVAAWTKRPLSGMVGTSTAQHARAVPHAASLRWRHPLAPRCAASPPQQGRLRSAKTWFYAPPHNAGEKPTSTSSKTHAAIGLTGRGRSAVGSTPAALRPRLAWHRR